MELWTAEHAKSLLPALVVMVIVAIVLRALLKEKPLKIRMIPIQILASILFLLEIGKQVLSLRNGYDLYHLPFHFCSLFIFMLPLMAFYRGKHYEKVFAITASICTAVLLLMLIYPNLIYSGSDVTRFFENYFCFHTVVFHNIVVFACILIVALHVHTPAPRGEVKAIAGFMVGFCAVSASMAQLLKVNFNNFYSCNIPPLESVRLSLQGTLGYGLTQLLYVLIVVVLDILFVTMSYFLYRGIRKRLCPNA